MWSKFSVFVAKKGILVTLSGGLRLPDEGGLKVTATLRLLSGDLGALAQRGAEMNSGSGGPGEAASLRRS